MISFPFSELRAHSFMDVASASLPRNRMIRSVDRLVDDRFIGFRLTVAEESKIPGFVKHRMTLTLSKYTCLSKNVFPFNVWLSNMGAFRPYTEFVNVPERASLSYKIHKFFTSPT